MRKKLQTISAIMLAVLLLTTALPFSVSAAESETDSLGAKSGTTGDCTWTRDDDGTLTISGNGAMKNYYQSSSLPWGKSISRVVIENGVTRIGDYSFYNCTSLTGITIPESVTSIGWSAFYNCTSMTGVYINDIAAWCNISFSNTSSNPISRSNNLYLNNELITDLVIPDSVTSIGNGAFCCCKSMTSVTIGNRVTSIGGSAFYYCSKLTNITIPDSVTSIGNEAFFN